MPKMHHLFMAAVLCVLSQLTTSAGSQEPQTMPDPAASPEAPVALPIHTIHFRPSQKGSFLGDVIPFHHDGVYHVFYLRAGTGPAPWAHIRSHDLVAWEELPDALIPGDDPKGIDAEGCWTGSVVALKEGGFRIFYTGKNMNDPLGDQKVVVADSLDLITWTKRPERTFYADGAIYWSKTVNGSIDALQPYHHQAFRDAEVVWNAKVNEWWMLLHACLADGTRPAFGLYASTDLDTWRVQPPLYTCPPNVTMSGDCPHFFEMDGRWYIVQAEHHYILSEHQEGPYGDDVRSFENGVMVVPKSMWDGKRRIIMGWLRDNEGFTDSGAEGWGGTMSMARELYALPNGELRQRPVAEVIASFKNPVITPDANAPAWRGKQGESVSHQVPGNGMLHCRVQLGPDSQFKMGFRENMNQPGSGYAFQLDSKEDWGELSSAYKKYRFPSGITPDRKIDIKAFLLNDIIELFVDDAWCFSMRVYDAREGFLTFTVTRGEGDLTDLSFKS